MNPFRAIWRWFRSLGQRRELKREIDEELHFHLEQRTAENIAAGMTPEKAARAARKRFGNLQSVREECRETHGANFGETTLQDIRFGSRMLRKNPGFTVIAALTLALGIGATSAVFSLIQGVLLTPPPYVKPDQIALIRSARIDGGPYMKGIANSQWLEWKSEAKSFVAMAGYKWGFDFLVLEDRSKTVEGLYVTLDYFKVIGTRPQIGREFLPSDAPTAKSQAAVVILGHELWQQQFHGDSNVIGKIIHLSRRPPLTVVGVMLPGIRFLPSPNNADEPNYNVNARVDYWVPVSPEEAGSKETIWDVVGRLRDGTTPATAQAELTAISARQAQADHDLEGVTAKSEMLTTCLNSEARRLLVPLSGAVALVFLIACGNVAGLLLARGLQRQQEYAVRCALGAGRWQLFRQSLTESLILAFVGGALGAGLATATVKGLKVVAGVAVPRLDAVNIGWPMLAFCCAAAGSAAVIAGLAPALRASRLDPASAAKGGLRSSASQADRRLLAGVAVAQTALTLALLVGAGLLIRTVNNLAQIRPGYDTQRILTMSITEVRHVQQVEGMDDDEKWAHRFLDFHRRALTQVAALPGVRSAAFAWGVPLTGNKWVIAVETGDQPGTGKFKDEVDVSCRAVSPGYFDTVGMQILQGRDFREEELFSWPPGNSNLPCAVIINQVMAARCFPNGVQVGKKFRVSLGGDNWSNAEIVGVVANSRNEALTQRSEPEIYLSYWQFPAGTKHLLARTTGDPRSVMASVQRELRALDPTVVIEDVRTLEQIRDDSIASQLFAMRLLAGFSIVASTLALVGIYGVLSLSVASRRREIAIRMAVGAQQRNVLGLVLSEGLKLIAIGLVIGTSIAIALGRVLGAFLFGVEPTDPITILIVAFLFTAVALLACFIPARRATRIDPMNALRHE